MIPQKHFVYLIQAGATTNYKIGISHNPQKRLANIQTSHYERLKILTTNSFDNRFITLAVEEELHQKYKNFNTVGEWFKFDIETISEVKKTIEDYQVSEVLLLKSINKELEAKNQNLEDKIKELLAHSSKPHHPKQSYQKTSKEDLLKKLFINVQKAGEKLQPKTKVIDINRRTEITSLSSLYKQLISIRAIELRGNKGYYSLMTYTEVKNKIGGK